VEIHRGASSLCRPQHHLYRVRNDELGIASFVFGQASIVRKLLILQFYRSLGSETELERDDIVVFTYRRSDDALVGALRFVEELDPRRAEIVLAILGVHVREDYCGRGVESNMLAYFIGVLAGLYADKPCFCIVPNAKVHRRFYELEGFVSIESFGTPTVLQTRVVEYEKKFGVEHCVLYRP
jgi:hypothetical protein